MSINSIQDVMQRLKNIEHKQIRRESEDYFEIVLNLEALEKIEPILEEYYGPAFKQAGVKAGREAEELSKKHGGVQKQQVLYYKICQGISQLAMIWPWQDGKNVTIKIIQVR